MTDDKRQSSRRESAPVDTDMILDLSFVPQWARRPPGAVRYADAKGPESERGKRGRRERGVKKRETHGRDVRRRRPAAGREPVTSQGRRDERRSGMRSQAGSARHREQRCGGPPPIPVTARFLPEQKALTGLVRQVTATKRAYPIMDLAGLLMSKPDCCFVKMEVSPDAGETSLYQCTVCKSVSLERDLLEAHVLADHIDACFEVDEEEGDPPSGTFVCVAKCGMTGLLLGPPNHHRYNEAVRRVHATRFSHMDLNAYKERIELSHAPEDVEHWKREAAKKVVYRLKRHADAEPEPMTWAEAERYMRDTFLPKAVVRKRAVSIPEAVAHAIRDSELKRLLRMTWEREARFPLKLTFALRAAFRHKHLYTFKTGKGKGVHFVTAVEPTPLDPDVTIPEIHDVLTYLHANPGCTRQQILEALCPGSDPQSEEAKALLQPLHWLVERGHIIEFFNGTLSVPLGMR